jgi:hypothetical protein
MKKYSGKKLKKEKIYIVKKRIIIYSNVMKKRKE